MKNHTIVCLMMTVAGIVLGLSSTSSACDCIPAKPEAEFARASAVFVGTVQKIEPIRDQHLNRVTLTIDQSWKLPVADQPTITVSTSISGASCGFGFRQGESYLVFAAGKPDALFTDTCTYNELLAKANPTMEILNQIVAGTYVAPPEPPPAPARPALVSEITTDDGVTVAIRKLGNMIEARSTASGKTLWQVQLDQPAQYIQIEGDKVVTTPQNLVLDLATGKVISR